MARYALNLPQQLKKDAEVIAGNQGVSLNQFILWAVAEKVGHLQQKIEDPAYPGIETRIGASGQESALLRGKGIHVRTIVMEHRNWGMTREDIAAEHELSLHQVEEALSYYEAHRKEVDADIAANEAPEPLG